MAREASKRHRVKTASRNLIQNFRNSVEGPQTLGSTKEFWTVLLLLLALMFTYPLWGNLYSISNTTLLLIYVFLGLSLGVIWGYTGIFSFGQVAFFGVGGYTYGIIAINFPNPLGTTAAVVISTLVATVFALLLGYLMFYGGITDVYVAIVTLVVTLVLNTFLAQTAGSRWAIGSARLGGANGMTGIPDLAVGVGEIAIEITDAMFYYLVLFLLLVTYFGLRWLLNSDIGYVMVGIRENESRTEMLGYDTSFIKTMVFGFGGTLAGLSGVLYVTWGNFISPTSVGLVFAAQPIIWVATGGRKWLVGAILGTYVITYFSRELSIYGGEYAIIILGSFLVLVILVLPEGFVPRIHARIPSVSSKISDVRGDLGR